jgi:hypothetical protein
MRLVLNVTSWPPIQDNMSGMSPSEGGKQQVDALIVHPADLRERERLDTRDVYLNQGCFRSSQD